MLAGPLGRRPEFFALRARAEGIVGCAFLRVLECSVGLGDLLETLLGLRLLRDVRMVFLRQPSIGLLDLLLRSAALDPERGVVVAVFHLAPFTGPAPWASPCSRRGFRTWTLEWLPRARSSRVSPRRRACRSHRHGGARELRSPSPGR